jgi:oxaloacetate decarboxylase alpha subunit
LLQPYVSYELVKALKEAVQLPVQLHTHYIGGLAVVSCIKAAEAGVDVIDTASVPMAFGSSQPPVETIVRALQEARMKPAWICTPCLKLPIILKISGSTRI